MILAIDFDGTIVEHRFPKIGEPVPGAFRWLKKFQEAGALLILLTMRGDRGKDGDFLSQAVKFCRANGIEFWAVNENPEQATWTTSEKVYAHHYIDDAAIGCPLQRNFGNDGWMVAWDAVGPMVMELIESRRKALAGES